MKKAGEREREREGVIAREPSSLSPAATRLLVGVSGFELGL